MEDSFFIRYPKTDVLFGKTVDKDVPKVLTEQIKDIKPTPTYNIVKEKDWSKHTKPCQDVLHGIPPINTAGEISFDILKGYRVTMTPPHIDLFKSAWNCVLMARIEF